MRHYSMVIFSKKKKKKSLLDFETSYIISYQDIQRKTVRNFEVLEIGRISYSLD